jgi:hypothetical protein
MYYIYVCLHKQGYDHKLAEKINQDRGCVVYPFSYNYREDEHQKTASVNGGAEGRRKSVKVANEEYLFMVLDGHGEHGGLVSEYAMRHVRNYSCAYIYKCVTCVYERRLQSEHCCSLLATLILKLMMMMMMIIMSVLAVGVDCVITAEPPVSAQRPSARPAGLRDERTRGARSV